MNKFTFRCSFIEGTVAEGAPIIPISAQLKYNIEVVCEYIEKKIPVPLRDFTSDPHLIIIRYMNFTGLQAKNTGKIEMLFCHIIFDAANVAYEQE